MRFHFSTVLFYNARNVHLLEVVFYRLVVKSESSMLKYYYCSSSSVHLLVLYHTKVAKLYHLILNDVALPDSSSGLHDITAQKLQTVFLCVRESEVAIPSAQSISQLSTPSESIFIKRYISLVIRTQFPCGEYLATWSIAQTQTWRVIASFVFIVNVKVNVYFVSSKTKGSNWLLF